MSTKNYNKLVRFLSPLSGNIYNSLNSLLLALNEHDKNAISRIYPEICTGPDIQTMFTIDPAILTGWKDDGFLGEVGNRTNPQRYSMAKIDAVLRSEAAGSFRSPIFQLQRDLIAASPNNDQVDAGEGTESKPILIQLLKTAHGYKITGKAPENGSPTLYCQFALQFAGTRLSSDKSRKLASRKKHAMPAPTPQAPTIKPSLLNKTFQQLLQNEKKVPPTKKDEQWIQETLTGYSNLQISSEDVAKYVDNICASISKPAEQADWIAKTIFSTKTSPTGFHSLLSSYASERKISCPSLQAIYRLSHWGLIRAILENEGCDQVPDDDQVVRILAKADKDKMVKFWKYVCKETSSESIRKEDLIAAAGSFLDETGIKIEITAEKVQLITNEAMKIIRPEVKKWKEAENSAPRAEHCPPFKPIFESVFKALGIDSTLAFRQLQQELADKIEPEVVESEQSDGLL